MRIQLQSILTSVERRPLLTVRPGRRQPFSSFRLLLGILISFPGLLSSAQPKPLSVLTTCRAVHHLATAEAERHYPVHLRARVTFYEVESEKSDPTLFVLDESGSVYVSLSGAPSNPLLAGDEVELTGVTAGGQYAPIVAQGSVKLIGHVGLPATAPRVGIGEMLSGERDGQWVEIEAVVHSVRFADGEVILNLSMQGGMIVAGAPVEKGVDYNSLIDAKILLRGNAAPLFNHRQQVTGGNINFPGIGSVRVEQPADPQPFSLAVTPVINLLRYTPDPGIQHRVHLRGRTTLFWPGRMVCLDDGTSSVCAQVTGSAPVRLGSWVEVIGFPNAGDFSPNLVYATYRSQANATGNSQVDAAFQSQTDGADRPVPPVVLSPKQALNDGSDGQLVSMEGVVIGEDAGAADLTLILSSENQTFSAILPKNPKEKLIPPAHGSRVRVTGICSVQSGGAADPAREGFPIANSFHLLLRSPADLTILQRPSWWNAVHTLRVLALALVLALFALWRMALLSHRVKEQTAVIRTQLMETAALKDAAESATLAAEFHAAHDELTGVLNRRSIFAELQKEFDIAAGSGYMIGVIMLDLDHFKRVNDTYGHLVGDEVLRETVRRLVPAVRSSDRIGRYGGEEFMIVLPRCDRSQLAACAERLRGAISRTPMHVVGTQITVTASVGATTIADPIIAMLDALAAADSALYEAKNSGRDKVILKDFATGEFEDTARRKSPVT